MYLNKADAESVGIRELAVGKRRRTEAMRAEAEETKVEDMISRFPNLMWYKSTRSSYNTMTSMTTIFSTREWRHGHN